LAQKIQRNITSISPVKCTVATWMSEVFFSTDLQLWLSISNSLSYTWLSW